MSDVQSQANDLRTSIQEQIASAKEALANNDIEKAKQIQGEVEETRKTLQELESMNDQLDQYESELEKASGEESKEDKPVEEETPKKDEQPVEETPVDDAKGEEQPAEAPEKQPKADEDKPKESVEAPSDDELEKKKKKGEKRNMSKLNNGIETNEKVNAFEEYMKSRGARRDNVISDDVGVTIPEDIKYQPEKEVNTVQDLSELVQKTSVSTASGKYPILKRANAKFSTVAELEKNPELARPEFQTINWEVATYRGAIPISQEALDDSVANITAIVSENINEQKINT